MAEPEPAELAAEVDDVGLGAGPRMRPRLHRVLLGGQAERIETQRVQHVAARHPEVAGVDVGGDVAERVPDVQALARRVREHVLDEHLVGGHRRPVGGRERPDRVGHVERTQPSPGLLPGAFDARRPAPRRSGAAGCPRRPSRLPLQSREQGSQRPCSDPSIVAIPATAWYRFRCRGVSAWLQVGSGPGGRRSTRGYSRRLATGTPGPRCHRDDPEGPTLDVRRCPPLGTSGRRFRRWDGMRRRPRRHHRLGRAQPAPAAVPAPATVTQTVTVQAGAPAAAVAGPNQLIGAPRRRRAPACPPSRTRRARRPSRPSCPPRRGTIADFLKEQERRARAAEGRRLQGAQHRAADADGLEPGARPERSRRLRRDRRPRRRRRAVHVQRRRGRSTSWSATSTRRRPSATASSTASSCRPGAPPTARSPTSAACRRRSSRAPTGRTT